MKALFFDIMTASSRFGETPRIRKRESFRVFICTESVASLMEEIVGQSQSRWQGDFHYAIEMSDLPPVCFFFSFFGL